MVKEEYDFFVDPVGDMLTRIRNGQMRSLNKISIPFSVFRSKILDVLKKEGYIIDFKINKDKNKKLLIVDLKYYEGRPVIREITRYLNQAEEFILGQPVYREYTAD